MTQTCASNGAENCEASFVGFVQLHTGLIQEIFLCLLHRCVQRTVRAVATPLSEVSCHYIGVIRMFFSNIMFFVFVTHICVLCIIPYVCCRLFLNTSVSHELLNRRHS